MYQENYSQFDFCWFDIDKTASHQSCSLACSFSPTGHCLVFLVSPHVLFQLVEQILLGATGFDLDFSQAKLHDGDLKQLASIICKRYSKV